MRIEVICTGDEVLTGKIINTNFSYMSQKLEDVGLAVQWETTVGDDRESLLLAFKLAGERADAVIVNGGLGPTVDDLSQEVAAQAAGVELALNQEWLTRMEDFFNRRSRTMPPNNVKQAMLPTTAEVIDNPIGTACGFALDIGRARFFFTPGVPRELRRMLEEQVIPRILAKSGVQAVIHLKRFHSYGLGESHVDALLTGVEEMVPDGSVKLGFRAHYPQLETKLTMRGADMDDIRKKLAPVESEVRKRLGNFILAEDDKTLEGVVLAELASRQGTLAIAETFTSGQIAARIGPLSGAEKVFRRGVVSREVSDLFAAVGLDGRAPAGELTRETAEAVAHAVRRQSGATHALAVLVDLDEGADRIEFGGAICLAIATAEGAESRRSRIVGGREWVRLGAVEMGLDCLRRQLQGLPVYERIDFEKVRGRRPSVLARCHATAKSSHRPGVRRPRARPGLRGVRQPGECSPPALGDRARHAGDGACGGPHRRQGARDGHHHARGARRGGAAGRREPRVVPRAVPARGAEPGVDEHPALRAGRAGADAHVGAARRPVAGDGECPPSRRSSRRAAPPSRTSSMASGTGRSWRCTSPSRGTEI